MPRGKKSDTPRGKVPAKTRPAKKDTKVTKPTSGGKKKGAASSKAKVPSMYQAVMNSTYNSMLAGSQASTQSRESVLSRATAKTKHLRKVAEQKLPLPCNGNDWTKSHGEQTDFINVFNRKLDKPLRAKIFRLVVVDNAHLVYVGASTKEQPDLAMTCRAIRREVLYLYYSENTFAIMLEGFRGKKKEKHPPENWLVMMEQSGHLRHVRSWAFADEVKIKSTEESNAMMPIHTARRPIIEAMVISLKQVEKDAAEDQDGTSWSGPQVHSDARCILSGDNKGSCEIKKCPSNLNKIVIDGMHDRVDGTITVQGMIGMLKSFAKQANEILELRCEQGTGIDAFFDLSKYLSNA